MVGASLTSYGSASSTRRAEILEPFPRKPTIASSNPRKNRRSGSNPPRQKGSPLLAESQAAYLRHRTSPTSCPTSSRPRGLVPRPLSEESTQGLLASSYERSPMGKQYVLKTLIEQAPQRVPEPPLDLFRILPQQKVRHKTQRALRRAHQPVGKSHGSSIRLS